MEAQSLTTHLYHRQDAIISLVQSLLLRRPAHECLFWLWELVYTIDDMVDSVRCIVLLFYSAAPSGLLRFIAVCLGKAALATELEQRAKILSSIIVNLRTTPPWVAGYLITTFQGDASLRPTRVYVSAASQQSPTLVCFQGAIKDRHYRNIAYYLGRIPDSSAIEKALPAGALPADGWKAADGDTVYLAGLLARSLAPTPKLAAGPAARCFVRPTAGDLSAIARTFTVLDSSSLAAWRKLPETRLYSIHSIVSPEWEPPQFGTDAVRNNWLFGCSEGVAWHRRLERHGASFQSQQICFASDKDEEEFNKLYALEFDEQAYHIQDVGLHAVERCEDPMQWLERLHVSTDSW